MTFFTSLCGRRWKASQIAGLILILSGLALQAQTPTNVESAVPDPTALETPGQTATVMATNAPPVVAAAPLPALSAPAPIVSNDNLSALSAGHLFAALFVLSGLGGFLLYHCGLTRAKNCGHTSMLLLVSVVFGLAGYWMGGFAVQTGGVGDAHAALAGPLTVAETGSLDHEIGFSLLGHHWGVMGSSGFFLMADETSREDNAVLFLSQAVLLALAVAAALGAAAERGRLLAMAVIAFLVGAGIYPLFANWVWGGGWLAELGHEFGLGHGCVDLAGAGVVHETAGVLALVIALSLGPRHGRFHGRTSIPGHNVPFTVLGALVLWIAFAASNGLSSAGSGASVATGAVALVNVVLGSVGGTLIEALLGLWRRQRPAPVRLCRGLLGGAVALCGGGAFFDPWAAFLIGACAGLLVDFAASRLEALRIDDPVGAAAIHGVGGAWGLLAVGFFANGAAGQDMNGVTGTVRGLFFGGGWHQLAAQAVGCAADFLVIFVLGYVGVHLVHKVLGNRVRLADEIQGLDWAQVGALGYQPDVEPEGGAGER